MNTLSQLLLSGVSAEADTGPSGGISFTLILILIIVALVAVLLIRDKKIRDKVKGFFSLIGKKIKNARIKSKIEKEEKEITELIGKLGQKGYEDDLFPAGSDKLIETIKKEKGIMDKLGRALAETEKKIDDLKAEFEIFASLKRSDIEKEEKVKAPVEKKFKEVSRLVSDLKRESGDNEKKITKIGRGIEKVEAELEKISGDGLLDPEEKRARTDREEKTLADLKEELSGITMREAAIPGELSILEKEEIDLKLKLDVFEKSINRLESEFSDAEKKHDGKIGQLVKEKGHLAGEKAKSENVLTGIYGELGKVYDKERPDNKDLSVIYIDIDRARERIKNLRAQLS